MKPIIVGIPAHHLNKIEVLQGSHSALYGSEAIGGTFFLESEKIGQSGNDNDHGVSGELYLFNPSSTTFVKHSLCQTNYCDHGDESHFHFYSGYLNTTTAVDAVQFTMSSGNIDSGTIKLYGIS